MNNPTEQPYLFKFTYLYQRYGEPEKNTFSCTMSYKESIQELMLPQNKRILETIATREIVKKRHHDIFNINLDKIQEYKE